MSNDLVYKQERKKPYNYPDPYSNMGLPVVNVGKAANEGYSYTSFQQFINEEMEEYGMNPGGEQKIDLRGKTDLEAIGDAEEKMDSMRIDYADFFKSNDGKRVDYLDTDGDLIAYVDVPTRKLYVMPDAPTMSDEEYAKIYGTGETRREEEEEFEDDYEKYSPEEEEEMPSFSQSERSTEDIERKLKSFERGTSRPFEPGEEEEFEFEDED
jgi:hypothetical protein